MEVLVRGQMRTQRTLDLRCPCPLHKTSPPVPIPSPLTCAAVAAPLSGTSEVSPFNYDTSQHIPHFTLIHQLIPLTCAAVAAPLSGTSEVSTRGAFHPRASARLRICSRSISSEECFWRSRWEAKWSRSLGVGGVRGGGVREVGAAVTAGVRDSASPPMHHMQSGIEWACLRSHRREHMT